MERGIETIHNNLLSIIKAGDIISGINYYRENSDSYSNLSHKDACIYWRQLFAEIERSAGMNHMGMSVHISKTKRDYTEENLFSLSEEELYTIRKKDRMEWRRDENLTAQGVLTYLSIYEDDLKMLNEMKDIVELGVLSEENPGLN
ncbi:hypothetical protein COU53_00565 [Candidatus Pacearchaeota archaeon CG10_big_fil_rev_8_21_14_0_10_30_48]|nr:MAG: hypothetical protein COU53_00565 [Candidatus Pacearchaeota archaeon CG10_big_fil_rev_8_21_14_0_10_30_48]